MLADGLYTGLLLSQHILNKANCSKHQLQNPDLSTCEAGSRNGRNASSSSSSSSSRRGLDAHNSSRGQHNKMKLSLTLATSNTDTRHTHW